MYRPDGEGPTPAVVMGHGFGLPRAVALYTYAEAFARAGYTVVVFDYRYFGRGEFAVADNVAAFGNERLDGFAGFGTDIAEQVAQRRSLPPGK